MFSNGTYFFADVPPGMYRVRFIRNTPALGKEFTLMNESTENDVNANGNSDAFDLAAGQTVQIDAGLIESGT